MRLFSALPVPAETADRLSLFNGGLIDARWVDPADFHVTLGFFGEIGRPVANELADALAELSNEPIDVRLTGLSVFGADKPHAIVALAERTPALLALATAHRAIMKRLEIGDTARKYTPHVTIARLRRCSAGAVAAWLSEQPAFQPCHWTADRFAIYSARTSRGGGPYVAEAEFPFATTSEGRTNSTETS